MARKRNMNPIMKVKLLQIFGVFVTFAPIIITVYCNKEKYFATKTAGISLTCGGVVAVVLVALAMMGKASKVFGSGVTVSGIIFLMAYLLEPVILNLQLLSGMLFFGFVAEKLLIAPQIRKAQRQVQAMETARAVKEGLNG